MENRPSGVLGTWRTDSTTNEAVEAAGGEAVPVIGPCVHLYAVQL